MFGDDQDDIVLIPYTTVRKRLQGSTRDDVHAIMVSARTTKQMNDAGFQIDQLLQDRHQIAPGEPRDFEVQNTKEIAAMMDDVMGITYIASAQNPTGTVGSTHPPGMQFSEGKQATGFAWFTFGVFVAVFSLARTQGTPVVERPASWSASR